MNTRPINAAVVLACLCTAGAQAITLHAITNAGRLLTLDTEDGSFEHIGFTGATLASGLDMDASGQLYTYTRPDAAGNASLYSIDPENAPSSLVGNLGVDFEFEGSLALRGDGTAYAIGGRNTPQGAGLFQVDLATGDATELGSLGEPDINGMVIRDDGMLVGWNQFEPGLMLFDPDTLQTTTFGDHFQSSTRTIGGMASLDGRHAFVYADTLVTQGSGPDGALLRVDLYTGDVELLQVFDGSLGITGIAIPSPWTGGSLILGLGTIASRRRRSPSL